MKIFPLSLVFTAVIISACTTAESYNRDSLISQNKIYENEIKLLKRENSVLRKEIAVNNETIKEDEARIEKLGLDLNNLQNKYDSDVKQLKHQYESLKKENSILIAESNEKIRELTEHNKHVELTLNKEITHQTSEIKRITDEFNNEREQLKKDSAKKEYKLITDLNEMTEQKKETEKKLGAEIDKLKNDIKTQADSFNNERAVLKKNHSDRETELVNQIRSMTDSLKSCDNVNTGSLEKIRSLGTKVDELQKQLDALKSGGKN
jgi:chromosome segregation ATPase